MWDWMFFRACLEMTGPVVVDGSWGSPSLYLVLLLSSTCFCLLVGEGHGYHILLQLLLQFPDKGIMHIRVNIYPFNGTATLPRTENCPVHYLRSNVLQIRICAYICRVITSQFQVQRDNTLRGSFSEPEAASCGAGECNKLDFRNLGNFIQDIQRAHMNYLQHVWWETGLVKERQQSFGDDGCLGRCSEDDGVSG